MRLAGMGLLDKHQNVAKVHTERQTGVKWLSKGTPASMTLMRSHHDSHEESHWLSWGVMLTLYTESDHSYDFFPEFKSALLR